MSEWTRDEHDPNQWHYGAYTLRCRNLIWELFHGEPCCALTPISHTHVRASYLTTPYADVPRSWAELIIDLYHEIPAEVVDAPDESVDNRTAGDTGSGAGVECVDLDNTVRCDDVE